MLEPVDQFRAALAGYTLHELACGGFLVAKWDRTAHCRNLRAVAAFVRLVGGAA